MDNKQGVTEMQTPLFSNDLQPEWQGMNNEYGGSVGRGEDLDAINYIPAGSMVCTEMGETARQVIKREGNYALYNVKKDPVVKKRGRPAKPDAKTNAERQAEFRTKRREAGICPCCGQTLK